VNISIVVILRIFFIAWRTALCAGVSTRAAREWSSMESAVMFVCMRVFIYSYTVSVKKSELVVGPFS